MSGGTDSAAMMHMAARQNTPEKFIIFTIDHGLRSESAKEVLSVKETAQKYGFKTVIIKFDHISQKGAIQKNARDARYKALAQAAKEHHCNIICIAHHKNDIMETLLSRLTHHSGLMGLAVMPPFFYHLGTLFHRPMLHLLRSDIENYAKHHNLNLLHDPSNKNEKYERVRHRNILYKNDDLCQPLLTLHEKAKALKYDITYARDLFIKSHMTLSSFGFCVIDHPAFKNIDDKTAIAVLKYAIHYVGGQQYVTLSHRPTKNMTLGGCYIHMNKRTISVYKEKRHQYEQSSPMGKTIYDNRFMLTLPEDGILTVKMQNNYDIPYFAKQTLPFLHGHSGKEYCFDALRPIYKPCGLEQFNSDPILHHLAISPLKLSSSK